MTKKIIAGGKYGSWTVVSQAEGRKSRNIIWNCKCDCGTERVVVSSVLFTGRSRSCGCHKSIVGLKKPIHGHASGGKRTRTYQSWHSLRTSKKMCDRWRNFENFLADMGECPPRTRLAMIDTDGGYAPGNCIWRERLSKMFSMTTAELQLILIGLDAIGSDDKRLAQIEALKEKIVRELDG